MNELRATRNLNTSKNGGAAARGFVMGPSEYPRGGSLTVSHISAANSTPGMPMSANVMRQPYRTLSQPASKLPMAAPTGTAIAYTASAVARFERGK